MSIPVPNRSAGQSASLISLASRTALLRLVKPTSPPPRQNDDDTHRDRRPPDPKPDPVKPIPASSQALCDFAAGRLASARSCIVESLPEDERFRPELMGGRIGLLLMGAAIAAHTDDRPVLRQVGIAARQALDGGPAVRRESKLRPGRTVVVNGIGGLGGYAVQYANCSGRLRRLSASRAARTSSLSPRRTARTTPSTPVARRRPKSRANWSVSPAAQPSMPCSTVSAARRR